MKALEIKKGLKVLKEMEACACLNLRKTTRLITQFYDQALEPTGLRITQLILLGMVAMAKSAPLTRLAKILIMDRTTFSRDLKPLIRENLVAISSGKDRRVRMVSLTRKGEVVLLGAVPCWEKAHRSLLGQLGPGTMKALLRQLESINSFIQQYNPEKGEGDSHEK